MNANSLQVLRPYKHEGFWVFDDESVGLKREPFVLGVDAMIDRLVEGIPNAAAGFRLIFSPRDFPGSTARLEWRREEAGGNWYFSPTFQIEGWLCPALFKYFDSAPETLFARAEAAETASFVRRAPAEQARHWFETLWNARKPAVIAEMMDPAAIGTTEGGEIRGPDAFRTLVYEPLVQAFPDLQVAIHGILADKDEAVIRWTVSATHTGPLLHLPPCGKRVQFSGITWLTFREGKIIGGSDSYNLHGLLTLLSGGPESATVRLA